MARGSQRAKIAKQPTTKKTTVYVAKARVKRNQSTVKNAKISRYKPPVRVQASPLRGAVVYNMTANKIIYENNKNSPISPASLTKILSMYVALDTMKARRIPPSSLVTVSAKAAAARGSSMGLRTGEKVPLEALLQGMAIASGNDASIAVAEYIGKSEAAFVQMMNKKARAIGMKNTLFKNANGLPAKGQVTTAADMLALARSYLATYPDNLNKYHKHRLLTHRGYTSTNANPLLGAFPGADGLKTGYVDESGYNLIATAKRGQTRLVGVFLGARSNDIRARESMQLLEAGFSRLAEAPPSPPKPSASSSAKELGQMGMQPTTISPGIAGSYRDARPAF